MIRTLAIALLLTSAARAEPVCIWADQVVKKSGPDELDLCAKANDGLRQLREQDATKLRQIERENAVLRAELEAMAAKFGALSRRADAAIAKKKPRKRRNRR